MNFQQIPDFITFSSIRPNAGLSLRTRMENFADIYFDFNDPVRTNTTVNTLWQPTYTPGVLDSVFVTEVKKPLAQKDISIYPNPTKGNLEVNVPQAGQMQLFNVQGEIVMEGDVRKGANPIQLTILPKGLYLVRFKIGEQQEVRKLVLE